MTWTNFFKFFDPGTRLGAVLLSILASIILIGLQNIFKWLQLLLSNFMLFHLTISYSLNGYWFSYEIENNEISIINLNKVIQRKHKVHFHVWQYSSQETQRQYKRYYSEGIMKGNHLSAYFYSVDKLLPETGAFTCKQEGQRLVGKYIQYSVDEDTADLIYSPDNYCLRRIALPYNSKIRMLFAQAPFETSEEAFNFIKEQERINKWRR
jgi:hypothetical protein